MGPKKAKDELEGDDFWRTSIEQAPLDDDKWNVKVIIIEAAGSEQDQIYLQKFELFAVQEKRSVIKNICKTETIFMINQLGSDKKVKDESLRVFEEGQSFLKDKKDIPPDILALIIKHLILKMKHEYLFIKRQRLSVKEGLRMESATMVNRAEVKGTVVVKPPEPPPPEVPPPTAKGKGKAAVKEVEEVVEPDEEKKYNTVLRVRGEEWRDKVYVDDYPADGPNLYVVLTGFMEPNLAACLIKIGIPLTAVIQVRLDPTTVLIPSSLFRNTKRGQSQTELIGEMCLRFWDDLQDLRIKNDCDILRNTAFIIFSPPICDEVGLSGDQDKIYDELSFLLFDLQDLSRQHVHYLENLHVICIPEEIPNDFLEQMYHYQIDHLPLESTTVFSVLESVLEAVTKNIEIEEKNSEASLLSMNSTNKASVKEEDEFSKVDLYVKDLFDNLRATDVQKKKYRTTYGDEYEEHTDPIIISHGDKSKYKTFHINQLNLKDILYSTLYNMPINKLWQYFDRLPSEREAKINFHVNVLLSCFDRRDIETSELIRLINILACRKLYDNRSSLKKQHLSQTTIVNLKKKYLKRSILAEPLKALPSFYTNKGSVNCLLNQNKSEESYKSLQSSFLSEETEDIKSIRMLFECPDLSELVNTFEITNQCTTQHMIENFQYFEEFTDVTAFQVINDAYNQYNCVDYKYCEVTDCLTCMFYNSYDSLGVSREEWRGHIATPVCLQDFFDFILEEHYDWIQTEEVFYDHITSLNSKSESKDLKYTVGMESCLESHKPETELIIEGSLKHQIILDREEFLNNEVQEFKVDSNTNVSSKSSKKTAPPTPKVLVKSITEADTNSDVISEPPPKPFNGYNLGDRRVEAFGKDSSYFSKDGTRVYAKYLSIIPFNLDYVMLNVISGNDINKFWVHKSFNANIESDNNKTCDSFRISTKDDVSVYIKKETYTVTIKVDNEDSLVQPSFANVSNLLNELIETNYFYSLLLTWPNGLITETVYENNSPVLTHIKQFYISSFKPFDEDMRCISMKGEVIVFKKNGDIEVLQAGGTYIKITKCDKRMKQEQLKEDTLSEASSGKNKKTKGKEKAPKSNVKVTKNESDDNEKVSDVKVMEYELFIHEFEIIHTDGLRQKCVNDNIFDIEKLLTRTATDYGLSEIYSRRNDGVSLLLKPDGKLITTFPCNTRIITSFIIEDEEIFPEWTEEELEYLTWLDVQVSENGSTKNSVPYLSEKSVLKQKTMSSIISSKMESISIFFTKERTDGYLSIRIIYSIENPYFTTVTIDESSDEVYLDIPNDTKITIEKNNNYKFVLDDVTNADFDGENLNITYKACRECSIFNRCKINIKSSDEDELGNENNAWLEMNDSFGKNVKVNDEADISVKEKTVSDHSLIINDVDEEINTEQTDNTMENSRASRGPDISVVQQEECKHLSEDKYIKFFILRRDLTCSELVHEALVEKYKTNCRTLPWCTVNFYETFEDYRTILSVLTPIFRTETEKWLMESKMANKPIFLAYKDLKHDEGKGFYHWMRPYGRFEPKPLKPDNAVPNRLPKAYISRTLERQWKRRKREELKGAKELIVAILRYRNIVDSNCERILEVPIREFRSEAEKKTDELVQSIGHRIYEKLKNRLDADVQSRMHLTITTKSSLHEGEEGEEESTSALKSIKDKINDLEEVEAAAEMSPNLKRYWRKRQEEYNEEQFYKFLLRESSVPPYFRNILGGAIWWEMNNAAYEAMDEAERRKRKCQCYKKKMQANVE